MQTRIQCEELDKQRRDAKIPINIDLKIDLARVQWEEQDQRREALERELTVADSQACMARVRARMRDGDKNWIPPMYNREKFHRRWLKKQRKLGNVLQIEGRR